MHDLYKGADSVKRFLNPQTKQNCKSVAQFIDDALRVGKNSIKSRYKVLVISLRLLQRTYVFLIDTIATFIISMLMYNHGIIMLCVNLMPGLTIWLKWMLIDTA